MRNVVVMAALAIGLVACAPEQPPVVTDPESVGELDNNAEGTRFGTEVDPETCQKQKRENGECI